jgi:hypothetical protein
VIYTADVRILAALRSASSDGLTVDVLAACCHDTAENVTAAAERLFMTGALGQWRRPHGPTHYYLVGRPVVNLTQLELFEVAVDVEQLALKLEVTT